VSFADAGVKVIEGVSAGLYSCGTSIMATSQALVPVDTGTLKRSGHVEEPVVTEHSVSVTLGYGYGEMTNPVTGERAIGYAKWVEIRDELKHKPPTQAHYLGEAARAHAPELPAFIEEGVRAKLAGEF
jgi:hypothetical protein